MALMTGNKFGLLKQILRFGIVGSSAAVVNFSIVILLVETGSLEPLYANVIAFFTAFQISYFGHRFWTFSATNAQHRTALPKLFMLQMGNFIANEGMFYFFLNTVKLAYPLALLATLAVLPVLTFTFSKFWIFREAS